MNLFPEHAKVPFGTWAALCELLGTDEPQEVLKRAIHHKAQLEGTQRDRRPIVYIEAVDWAIYSHQTSAQDHYEVTKGAIIGFLVDENEEKLVLCHHWFDPDGQLRHTTVIPKVCINRRIDL